MDSHDYANQLLNISTFLKLRPAFPVPNWMGQLQYIHYGFAKKDFLAAVKALGSGTKNFSDSNSVEFMPTDGMGFSVRVDRDRVCRKVKEAEYECESLLSEGEL